MQPDGHTDFEDLEPIQYEDLYREDDAPLADVRENALRVLVYAGVALTALFILLGLTIDVPRHLSLAFTLEGDRQEHVARFFEPALVEEAFVAPTEEVAAGDTLARIQLAESGPLMLRAPAGGTVAEIAAAGKAVESGSVVLRLLGEGSGLHAVASVPPEQVGQLREGDPAVLKLSAFPHYEWGTVAGAIRYLDRTPDASGRYRMEVELADLGRLGPSLREGLTGELSVQVEKRSFFGYLFENL